VSAVGSGSGRFRSERAVIPVRSCWTGASQPSAPACARLELVYALPREPRIRAHVLLCWLALLLIRLAERRTGQTWPTLARELGRLHAVTLTGPTGPVTQTTELTTAQQGILRACGLTPPPRITALHPA